MGSLLFYTSLSTSTSVFPKTHLPITFQIHEIQSSSLVYSISNFNLKPTLKKKATLIKAVETAETIKTSAATRNRAVANTPEKKLKVLVAGGGIGGLVFALAAKKKGFEVVVFEKDLSAIRGEGQYRGPIQTQGNALAALEAIDMDVAEQVMAAGCVTGDRINGLVDGVSGNWYIKFDLFTPAVERGLPLTRIISRMTLQEILAGAVGEELIMNASNVVDFKDDGNKVTVILDNGKEYVGDLLVGADGIWSKVRKNLFGHTQPVYFGYTCYTGIADFIPADIDSVGYRVFLGHKQYFVSTDVGGGRYQWYAFHNESPGGADAPNGKKQRLLEIFDGWCDSVIDLVMATEEDAILRRDVYDKQPSLSWGKGRVTLLGDSIHAMQPNLGQAGCMAIEDSYQLAFELDEACNRSIKSRNPVDVVSSLRSYERARKFRVAVIHGIVRMTSAMVSLYTPYLGVGLGPLSFLTKFRIPHPGIVGGRWLITQGLPLILSWILSGNSERLEGRTPLCRLSEKANSQLQRWLEDDDALERAISGEWFLLPTGNSTVGSQPIALSRNGDNPYPCIVGRLTHEDFPGTSIRLDSPQVSEKYAQIICKNGAFFVTDLRSKHGTWITDNEGRRYKLPPNFPSRIHPSYVIEFGPDRKVACRVKVMMTLTKVPEERNASNDLQMA